MPLALGVGLSSTRRVRSKRSLHGHWKLDTKQGLAGRSFEGHNSASSNFVDLFFPSPFSLSDWRAYAALQGVQLAVVFPRFGRTNHGRMFWTDVLENIDGCIQINANCG
jgi:hypothetical protein